MTQNKGSRCRKICMLLCQQTSPKHWFRNI